MGELCARPTVLSSHKSAQLRVFLGSECPLEVNTVPLISHCANARTAGNTEHLVPHPFARIWRKDGNKTPESVFHITLDDRWRIEGGRHETRLSHPTKRRLGKPPGFTPVQVPAQCQ